ncbi:Ras guanine nucleotide exchange factor, variant 2 [Balamuthia mandrillaris]
MLSIHHRNELQQALNIVTKRVEQLCSSVNLLSRTTQQSFGGLYFPKLNHSSQRIFEALPSLRSSAWQLLRVGPVSSSSFSPASSPSPPPSFELPPLSASSYLYSSSSAQSEFSSTVIFINDHLLHIRVIVRPFLQEKALMGLIQERSKKMDNEAKGGGSAGHLVIWEDVGEESNKAARLEETVFSLARELAYSLQDLAAVSQQIGEGGAEAAWRLSNDTQERLLKLLEAARKRALLMESTQQRLSLLEQVTNFRIQAWEVLHKAKKFIQPRRTKYDFLYHKTNSNSSKEEFEDEKEKKKLMRQSMLKKVIGSRQLNNEKNSFIVFLTPQEKEELEEIKRQALRLGEALLHLLNVFSRALHSNSSPTSSASAQQQKPTDSSPLKPSVILPLSPPSSSAITPSSSSNADVDIWQEPQGAEGTVIYQKRGITSVQKFGTKITSPNESRSSFFAKGIKAGTLNQLVIRLTHEYCHDLGFVKTFITTFQSFTTPQVLFEKLMQRFNVPLSTKGDVPEEQWIKHMVLPIQIRVVNVLGLWMKTRFADFDYDLIKRVNAFIDDITKDEKRKDWSEKWAKQLSRIIRRQIEQRRGETANRATQTKGSGGGISKILKGQEPDYLNNFDVKTLAQHFCVVEFAIFRAIQPVELLNQAWNKEKYHHRAPNVRSLIQLFNKVSRWISSSILREDKLKKRAKLMTKYLELAIQLFDYNNFNASLAIISGINNAAVHRLRFTRDEVASRLWDQIHDIQEVLGGKNYSCYRERLHSVNPPLLPYLGVYLTDLTFIEDGNPDFIGDLINFKKRELIYDVISEVQQYQQTEYSFTVDAGVVAFLKNLPMEEMEENDMYNLSLKREPRGIEKPSELP